MSAHIESEQHDAGFAEQIRSATWEAHEAAEHAPFVQDLLAGRLGVADYVRFLVQLRSVYETLEAAVAANQDPTLAPFFVPELERLPAIEADLDSLAPRVWRVVPVLEATQDYCEQLRHLHVAWPRGVLAHHYVRYLGDLSGGQIIGRILRRVLDLDDGLGVALYRFEQIRSPKAFKVQYRAALDELAWDEGDRARLIAEAVAAFHANTEILLDLHVEPILELDTDPVAP